MSNNLIAYWENWLNSKEDINITVNGYILKYSMINQYTNEGVQHWVCCISKKKLYSFIKYLLLPSIIISKTIGLEEGTVFFEAFDYDETIGLLENSKINGYEKCIEDYNRWIEEIEKLEANDSKFENLRDFINKVCLEIDYKQGLYLDLELFENIKSVGKTLIKEYEDDDMIDVLESTMELSKEEIEDLFENIDENKFMLKKITTLLDERFN